MMDKKHEAIETAENLLAHLICADNDDAYNNITGNKRGVEMEEIDAGMVLKFDVMRPKLAHTIDMVDGDRLFTTDPNLLITSVPDILGLESEVALMKDGYCLWMGMRRLKRVPRNIWVSGKVGAIYEVHWRQIFPDGRSYYYLRCAAVSPTGLPLNCVIQGTRNPNSKDRVTLVMCASIIEDTARTGCFTASIQDAAGVVFPVPYGSQVELFRLRDGPNTPSGRRKAILHWVAKHMRSTTKGQTEVREHMRGVHQFNIDGLRVRLAANDVVETC